jgi:periplasmic protein TonB
MYASPKRSTLISGLLHAAVIGLVLMTTAVKTPLVNPMHYVMYEPVDLHRYVMPHAGDGGGGGGVRSDTAASKGVLPRVSRHAFTPPVAKYENLNPILPMEPAIQGNYEGPVVKITLPFGDPNGVAGPASGGPGDGGGIGAGHGPGVGDHRGPGSGPRDGSGVEGITARYASDATQPALLYKVEPEYSEEARKVKLQGEVVLRIEVDPRGIARNISVVQSLGLGLDERAIAAVSRWRFRPGYSGGKPVVTPAMIHVTFRLL